MKYKNQQASKLEERPFIVIRDRNNLQSNF
jgi:hypothetical protein